ncbi:MAG: hypothetical protein ACU0CA_12830 [Paracoccaceae bacterium]
MTTETETETEIETDTATAARSALPLILLIIVGTMIAFSVNLSKLVAVMGAPTLWLVGLSQTGAGLIVLILAKATGQFQSSARLLAYVLGAGAFLAVPTVLSFLSVGPVGASFISLVYAFPILLTYLLAVLLRIDRFQTGKILGVTCGLVGGLILSLTNFNTTSGGIWIIAASSIPLILAFGNVYRTVYWPAGAGAVLLAGLTLLISGGLIMMLAIFTEGDAIQLLWQRPDFTLLLLANMAVFAVQFVSYFMLQRIAGPTYLSQIGSVAAIVGVGIAYFAFKEALPQNFTLVIILVVAGVVLFQRAALNARAPD